jgi:hypothetical protein
MLKKRGITNGILIRRFLISSLTTCKRGVILN